MSVAETPTPRGRPPKYRKSYADRAYKLALAGITEAVMAEVLEIHVDTLYDWKQKFPSFSDAIKRGGILADIPVIASTRQMAMGGYKTKQITKEKIKGKMRVTREVITEHKPDARSQGLWLGNRMRKYGWHLPGGLTAELVNNIQIKQNALEAGADPRLDLTDDLEAAHILVAILEAGEAALPAIIDHDPDE